MQELGLVATGEGAGAAGGKGGEKKKSKKQLRQEEFRRAKLARRQAKRDAAGVETKKFSVMHDRRRGDRGV
jgi:hypothetical protein